MKLVARARLRRDADATSTWRIRSSAATRPRRSRCAAPSAWPSTCDQEIRLYWRGQAVTAQSTLVPNTVRLRPEVQEREWRVRPGARASALLDTLWLRRQRRRRLARAARRQPARARLGDDAGPARSRSATSCGARTWTRSASRSIFKAAEVAGEPQARARRQAADLEPRPGAPLRPTASDALDRAASIAQGRAEPRALQTARQFDEIYERMTFAARRAGARRAVPRGQAHRRRPTCRYKHQVHRILTDLDAPLGRRLPPPAVLARVVARTSTSTPPRSSASST